MAVGTLCGGGMYLIGVFTVMCTVLMLRFGPRAAELDENNPHRVRNVVILFTIIILYYVLVLLHYYHRYYYHYVFRIVMLRFGPRAVGLDNHPQREFCHSFIIIIWLLFYHYYFIIILFCTVIFIIMLSSLFYFFVITNHTSH